MKPSRVETVLSHTLTTRWPTFLWGPPGVGKSSIVRKIADDKGLHLLDVRASLLDPTDLRGLPYVADDRAHWSPPSFLPHEPDSQGLLFFDELNAAPPLVQASLYQLTLDRRVGEYELPAGWSIVAAGNRAEDGSVTYRMPAALANRFIHLEFEVNFEDWRSWAVHHGIHYLVRGFLSTRRELLFEMKEPERGFPTPRSWEMVSDVLHSFGSIEDCNDLLLGIVGEGASVEFAGYCQKAISEERILEIMADPENASIPKKLGDQYALISYLGGQADSAEARTASAGLLSRLKPEISVLLLRNILDHYPRFAAESGVQAFMREHHQLVS